MYSHVRDVKAHVDSHVTRIATAPGPVTDAGTRARPCTLTTFRIHFLNAGQKPSKRRPTISFGNALKGQDTPEPSPLCLEWVVGSAAGSRTIVLLPRLEGNYRDKDRDSEGNTPGFQRSPYQDEGERWHDGCSVFYLCRVHFLSQRQSIPTQKTRLQKNNLQMQWKGK